MLSLLLQVTYQVLQRRVLIGVWECFRIVVTNCKVCFLKIVRFKLVRAFRGSGVPYTRHALARV